MSIDLELSNRVAKEYGPHIGSAVQGDRHVGGVWGAAFHHLDEGGLYG